MLEEWQNIFFIFTTVSALPCNCVVGNLQYCIWLNIGNVYTVVIPVIYGSLVENYLSESIKQGTIIYSCCTHNWCNVDIVYV